MRFLKYTSLAALVFASAACQDDGGVSVTSVPPLAFVRYINAVPDSLVPAIVSIRINAVTTLPETTFTTTNYTSTLRFTDYLEFTPQAWANVSFRGLGNGGYQGVKAGNRTFKIFTFDPTFFSTTVRADTSFNFVAGSYYTIVHWQDGSAAEHVRILSETHPAVNATNFQYKLVNLAQGIGALDGYQTADSTTAIAGATTVAGIAELGASAYVSAAPVAVAALQVTNAGTTTRVAGPRAPAGGASGTTLENFVGTNVGGSVLTAFAFRGQPLVAQFNRTWRAAQAPTVVWFMDRRPGTFTP
jgi:hypothetical protein